MRDVIEGRAWVFGDSVDTDNMYPGFAMKLPLQEAAKHVFYDLRPGWTDEVAAGDIVIAGRNFGIGSSRPVAQLFLELGVVALVAEEFNSLFLRNSINFGLPAVTIPGAATTIADGSKVRLDIPAATIEPASGGAPLTAPRCPSSCSTSSPRAGSCPNWQPTGTCPPRAHDNDEERHRTWSVAGAPPGQTRAGESKLAWNQPGLDAPETITLTSPAFADGSEMPESSAGRGRNQRLPAAGLERHSRGCGRARPDHRRPDAPLPRPVVHLALAGIAPELRGFAEGDLNEGRPHGDGRGSSTGRAMPAPAPCPGMGSTATCSSSTPSRAPSTFHQAPSQNRSSRPSRERSSREADSTGHTSDKKHVARRGSPVFPTHRSGFSPDT